MKTVCIDFDGVLNNYKYFDEEELFTPREGCEEFLKELSENYLVIICTARKYENVEKWLLHYDLRKYVSHVTSIKPPASVYLDDRAVPFKGDYANALEKIKDFKAYWEK